MPKITKPLKPGDEKQVITSVVAADAPQSSLPDREWANCSPAEEVDGVLYLDFLMNRVDCVRRAVWRDRKDGETTLYCRLDELLPRSLWLKLLFQSLIVYFNGDDEDFLGYFDGVDAVVLDWSETYEDEDPEKEGPWITVYAEDTFVGYGSYKDFFEEWETHALLWLIPELGITPKKLRSALARLLPPE